MENYIKNYGLYNKKIVYDFKLGYGGIGDNIKFFMFVLESCMKNNTALYYKINNIDNEKYIKLNYNIMYVNESRLKELGQVTVVNPCMYYRTINYNYSININEVFYFSDEVKVNSKILFPENITDYVSIHLRLGDKYLETETKYVLCKYDERRFSEENINKFIEEHSNENIFFCCDNNAYKLKLKEKYNNIIITNCQIGHTSLSNTTPEQVLDGITEFYILTNSKQIFAASESGFSIIASKFNNIPLLK
jgi:hypothetical protein